MNFLKQIIMRSVLICLLMTGIAGSIQVQAAVIDNAPSGNHFQFIASNVPAHGNVWTGVAQSFVAKDPNIVFGFYMQSNNKGNGGEVLFSLYSGDGVFSNLLGQRIVQINESSPYSKMFVEADFSSITLTQGNSYTMVISLASQSLPDIDTYSDIGIRYASSPEMLNPYAEGRFYYVGASYNMDDPAFSTRDFAFRISPKKQLPDKVTAYLHLTDEMVPFTVPYGANMLVFGSSGGNTLNVATGARLECRNFTGSNVLNIQDETSIFVVYRYSNTVYLKSESTGTIIQIPSTKTPQTLRFGNGSSTLSIINNEVVIGGQSVKISEAPLQNPVNIADTSTGMF